MQPRGDAGSKIVNTTELLEKILIDVDMRTLLFSQRINKQFKAVVLGSIKLQKKLFFIRPTFNEAVELGIVNDWDMTWSYSPNMVAICNPLVVDVMRKEKFESDSRIICRVAPAIVLDRMRPAYSYSS